jgi:3-phenylpropionate/trans-cinnamate dioxygenase ferredoxin subunit
MNEQGHPDIRATKPGEIAAFDIDGRRVAVANVSGTLFAFDDACTHRHCSLAKGRLSGTTVTCECHGSQFDVRTGTVLRGPAAQPVRTYQIDQAGSVIVDVAGVPHALHDKG